MGRPRRRRVVIGRVRSSGSISRARGEQRSRPLPRARDDSHRLHHRARLQPGHRAVPDRRRRLPRDHEPARTIRRPRRRRCAGRRLRADDCDLGCERGRPVVQPAAESGTGSTVQAVARNSDRAGIDRSQPARDEGIDQDPAADLPRLRDHASRADRLWDRLPCGRFAERSRADDSGDRQSHRTDRRNRHDLRIAARVRAGRRNLYGHRGGVEQRELACRAARADRQADDVLHGCVTRGGRRRDPVVVPAVARAPRRGHDTECGLVRADHRELRIQGCLCQLAAADDRPRARGRPALRRGEYRIPGRPVGALQHGRRFLGATQVPLSIHATRYPKRHHHDGPRGARDPVLDQGPDDAARRAVFDQRLPHLRAVALRIVQVLVDSSRRAALVPALAAVAHRVGDLRGDPGDADRQQLHVRRLGDAVHHRRARRGVHLHPAPLRRHQGPAQEDRLDLRRAAAGSAGLRTAARARCADRCVHRRFEQGRRRPHTALGAANVPGTLPQFHLHQCAHR